MNDKPLSLEEAIKLCMTALDDGTADDRRQALRAAELALENANRPLQLVTSRFHYKGELPEGFVPVGVVRRPPRFTPPIKMVENCKTLAPKPDMFGLEPEEFIPVFLRHLDYIGREAIEKELHDIQVRHGAQGLVLLCFENLAEKPLCHRRVFAEWWERETKTPCPDLEPCPRYTKFRKLKAQ